MTEIVLLSLKIAAVAVTVTTPVAILLGYMLARWSFPGKSILNALVYLPLVLPPVVSGYLLLQLFGPHGPLGVLLMDWLGIEFAFRWTGAALAAGVMALPLILRPIKLGFETIEQHQIDAAKILGASRLKTFVFVSLPLAMPGIIAGLVLGFARSMAEFGATITFVSNIPGETQTLPLGIYALMQSPDGDHEARMLVIIAVILSLSMVYFSEWLASNLHRRTKGE